MASGKNSSLDILPGPKRNSAHPWGDNAPSLLPLFFLTHLRILDTLQLQNIFISSLPCSSVPLDYSILVHKLCENPNELFSLDSFRIILSTHYVNSAVLDTKNTKVFSKRQKHLRSFKNSVSLPFYVHGENSQEM